MLTPRDKAPFPIWWLYPELGAPSFGGGLLTASGLYFTGASTERAFWAFDSETGSEIWKVRIPFNVHDDTISAGPMLRRLRALRVNVVSGAYAPDDRFTQLPIARLRVT